MTNIWLVVSTPLNRYENQLGLLFPIYGKIKNVPNQQQDMILSYLNIFDWVWNRLSSNLQMVGRARY